MVRFQGLCGAILLGCVCVTAHGSPCPPLTDTGKAKIVVYLSKWLETENLSIETAEIVRGTCYRRLSVKAGAPQPIFFFLTADQRFLSGSLLDTAVDPEQERRIAHEEANRALLSDPSPSRGSLSAPITIVEFGDFQCPYCKKIHELLASHKEESFRLVYKHLPLQGHMWARDASAFAICADFQSGSAFWKLHDFFFDNQGAFTASNLGERTMEFAGSLPGIDGESLAECLRSGQADAKLAKDAELGKKFRVTGTPTIFVNGRRGGDIQSADDLKNLVQKAKRERKNEN